MENSEEDKKTALSEARQAERDSHAATAPESEQPREPAINFLADLPYIFAILIAGTKDLSDYIGLGSWPLIGTLITLLVLCLLTLLVFLASPSDFFRNFGFLFGGTAIDMIPFLNLLPALTAATLFIYGKTVAQRILKNKGIGAKIITRYAARGKI